MIDFDDWFSHYRCRAIEGLLKDSELEPYGNHQVIHYYCTGSKPGETRSNCDLFLRALIRQLARTSSKSLVAGPVQVEYNRQKMENPSQYAISVNHCENLLTELIPDDPGMRVTVVIDALDECENNGYELLECLKRILRSWPQSIRLLLSSQMHVRVKEFSSTMESNAFKSARPERKTTWRISSWRKWRNTADPLLKASWNPTKH